MQIKLPGVVLTKPDRTCGVPASCRAQVGTATWHSTLTASCRLAPHLRLAVQSRETRHRSCGNCEWNEPIVTRSQPFVHLPRGRTLLPSGRAGGRDGKMITLTILVLGVFAALLILIVLVATAISREEARHSLHEAPPGRAAAFTRRLLGWQGSMPPGFIPLNRLGYQAEPLRHSRPRSRVSVTATPLQDSQAPADNVGDRRQPAFQK